MPIGMPSWLGLLLMCLLFSGLESGSGLSSRELIEWEEGPPGVAWVVQISDLHISAFHPERSQALHRLLGPALATIKPALLLVTGDLTDAKNKQRTSTRQDEAEWREYHDTIEAIIQSSGIAKHSVLDLRGNHDKYGVPFIGSDLDFFSRYSASAQMNRTCPIQSVTVMGKDKHKFLFVGVDNSMRIGLRGPSNLFAHQTDQVLRELDSELGQWEEEESALGMQVPKIAFGHFPLSFTTSTESHNLVEHVLAKHSVSAYICGHLHAKFGKRLYKHYLYNLARGEEFWEWEVGDWRESRVMRVIAIDKGSVSFVDIDLSRIALSSDGLPIDLPTVIIPTSPLNSMTMQRGLLGTPESIRALVFSQSPIISVVAKIFDSRHHFQVVEEFELQPCSNCSKGSPFYTCKFNAENYRDPSAVRFWLQVFAMDVSGRQYAAERQPFSVAGKYSPLKQSWIEYLLMGFRWEDQLFRLTWGMVFLLFCLLLLPHLFYLYLKSRGLYQKWVIRTLNLNNDKQGLGRAIFTVPVWVLVEGSRVKWINASQILYLVCLLVFPWMSGSVLAEGYPVGSLYIWGWAVRLRPSSSWQYGVGFPDIFIIFIPFLYLVLFPLVVLVSSLFAERAARELHAVSKFKCGAGLEDKPWSQQAEDSRSLAQINAIKPQAADARRLPPCKLCRGWFRAGLIVTLLAILCIHFQQCLFLARAFGAKALFASPMFALPVPLLVIVALHQTTYKAQASSACIY